jgi:hypothetical protein
MFKHAPDALSYCPTTFRMMGKSSDFVTKIVTPSVYAITAVCHKFRPRRTSVRLFSRGERKGFMHSAKSPLLKGQPCRMWHWSGVGLAISPLVCSEETALSYILRMRSTNHSLRL